MRPFAWAYAVSALAGTVLAVRRKLPARLFGLETGRGAGFDAVIGYGTGISAPWTMVVALLFLVRRGDLTSRRLVQLMAVLFVLGQLGEPVTRELSWSRNPLEKAVVTANIAVPVAILIRSVTVSGRYRSRQRPWFSS